MDFQYNNPNRFVQGNLIASYATFDSKLQSYCDLFDLVQSIIYCSLHTFIILIIAHFMIAQLNCGHLIFQQIHVEHSFILNWDTLEGTNNSTEARSNGLLLNQNGLLLFIYC